MKKQILFALSAALVGFASCTDDTMDKINVDPHHAAPELVSANLQLTDAIMSTAFSTVSGDYAFYTSSLTEQLIGSGNNQLMKAELRQSVELAASTTFNNVWGSTYSNIMSLNQMMDKINNDIAGCGGQLDVLGAAQLLKAINLGYLTDMHGDIPYSEAFMGYENMQPKLDSQQSIYTEIMKLIDDAISNLTNSSSKNLSKDQDILFHGNINQWLASAYAIKARYLIHQSKVNAGAVAQAKEAAKKALELGFAGMNLSEFNGVTCDNPWSAFVWSRFYTTCSTHVTGYMVGDDPRYVYYNGDVAVDPGDEVAAKISANYDYPLYYDLGSQPVHIMSLPELYFILAEAQLRTGDDATEAFQAGVAASIDEQAAWLGDDADGATYAATLGTPTLKEVFEQKYIALAVDGQPETYNDIRRLKAMGENYIVLTNPFNNQSGLNRWPEVLPYGNSSVVANPNVAAVYGDGTYVYSTKAWLFN